MFEKALIDGDIVTYRCAAATADADVAIACWQAGEMMTRILDETNSQSFDCFLTGGNNFRFSLYPEYKANRKDTPKPRHWAAIREYLCAVWDAKVSDGCEADDLMGVGQCAASYGTTCIASIDKDMLMIPGWHYNFVKQELKEVSPLQGMRWLYTQAIMGDKVDNIPGFDGKMRSKVPKKMQWMIDYINSEEDEMKLYEFVKSEHYAEVDLDTCLKCLWLWRKEGDVFVPPHERMV